MAVKERHIPVNTTKPAPAKTKTGCPVLNHPLLKWKSPDKYLGLCNFEVKVKNIFLTNRYNIQESKNSNWLGHEGIGFMQTLNDTENQNAALVQGYLKGLVKNSNQT